MNDYDVDACMKAFGSFCEDTERSELVGAEDCQYWVFERGYIAAMDALAKTIQSGKTEVMSSIATLPPTNRLAMH